jgi:ribosomal protein L40E
MRKKVKDHRPGIRVPTAKGSIRFKSKKDYNRHGHKVWICFQCNMPNPIDDTSCIFCEFRGRQDEEN